MRRGAMSGSALLPPPMGAAPALSVRLYSARGRRPLLCSGPSPCGGGAAARVLPEEVAGRASSKPIIVSISISLSLYLSFSLFRTPLGPFQCTRALIPSI